MHKFKSAFYETFLKEQWLAYSCNFNFKYFNSIIYWNLTVATESINLKLQVYNSKGTYLYYVTGSGGEGSFNLVTGAEGGGLGLEGQY